MGSATREAEHAAVAALRALGAVDQLTGEQLLAATLVVDTSPQLRAALSDDTAESASREGIVRSVFGGYTPAAQSVLTTLSTSRWSSEADFVSAIEQLGIRALAASAPKTISIDNELFAFSAAVASNSQLELALGSRLGASKGKVALVRDLLQGKASAQTLAILSALIGQPRGRRVAELVRYAAAIVADESGFTIATITVATELSAKQTTRLASALSTRYGANIRINEIVDPTILGGMRVQIGDAVIDGSIANRITDLRLRLAS